MPKKDLSYLVISDIHLGHRKVKTVEICKNLDSYFENFKLDTVFSKLDVIFIAGDLFDGLLDFASEDIHVATIFLSRLIKFCSYNNIKLRVLEGTPSHDWRQSKIVQTLVELLKKPIDFKYVDTLHIELMDDLGISILYVPDEWTPNANLTFTQVQDLLKLHRLSEVDVAIMHGMFQHQMRNVHNHPQTHDASKYLNIVKYFIHVGHVHSFSFEDRIIAEGSFDRLAHGEEEAKGGVLAQISKEGDTRFDFIENKLAKTFKTIVFRDKDLEKSQDKLLKELRKLKPDSYVRIKASTDHPLYAGLEAVKRKYPEFNFSRISLDKEEKSTQLLNTIQTEADYVPIMITKDNIKTLLLDAIRSQYSLTQNEYSILDSILENTNA